MMHRITDVLFPMSVHGWALPVYMICALIVGIVGLFALMSVPPRYRKLVVAGITFLGGLYFSLEFLLPHQPVAHVPGSAGVAHFAESLTKAKPSVADWAMIIGSFALLLGTSNLFAIHGRAVKKKTSGWYNSLAFFISFFAIMIVGFLKDSPIRWFGPHNASAIQSASKSLYLILFNGFVQNLDATMFSLIAFYIVSAAYRAFRVRSAEAGLMMGTAGIIMLGLVPVGAWLTSWLPHTGPLASLRLESITYWLLIWPNMAVQRAIEFGLAIGAVAMSLRIWLSLERGSFFDRQL
jgi:hypothetical protein